MQNAPTIKPTHRAIKKYYEALGRIHAQGVEHETATRSAFQNLLSDLAKARNWDLIPELGGKHAGNRVVPDGTVRDLSFLPRGYWEAKDTKDKLDAEIAKKIERGYPTTNIIFEDTRQGVLYQDGEEVLRANLGVPQELADLLNRFFSHTEPDIEKFEKAVDEFRSRVPELAQGLMQKIEEAHKNNAKFKTAFDGFFRLCQHSLNPNISQAAVDEMLAQHLLTERLIRTIFDNADFTRRNVIAAEVEKVIDALVSKSFNRDAFLKSLDRFYLAIEDAARGLAEFSEKQHFLNSVYERFFQGFSVKIADTHGIVYTPQPIVDFMCASVAEVLDKEFGKTLGSKDVNILDPCTGTGNFIVNILRRIPKRDVKRMYKEQLFANEVMLLPYYIAALNIEHAHYEITGEYQAFEGLCFVDTLDMAEHAQAEFEFMIPANTERVKRQKNTPITVIIGNPPYNVGQLNENDNNKNRKYPVIDKRISQTYARDSAATNKNALSDAYVKFFRWAVDRLEGRDGIVCFVSNNSFVDQLAFDGMRKHFASDFTHIYHVDLHGNVRKNPKLSGTTHNVFGIQVGVGITVAVRKAGPDRCAIQYHRVPEHWRKEEKLQWLRERSSIAGFSTAAVPAASKHRNSSHRADEDVGGTNKISGSEMRGAGEIDGLRIRTRGYLPHWEAPGTSYFITFNLKDSLPAHVLAELAAELGHDKKLPKERIEKIEQHLDSGAGACYLKDPGIAPMVRDALFHFNGQRYRLLAWCVMPNHVHLLLSMHPEYKLETVLHSIKSYTAHKANALLKRKGAFWQHESYDRIVRDEREYETFMAYIGDNPAKALLQDWPWAGYEGDDGAGAPSYEESGFLSAFGTNSSTNSSTAAVPAAPPLDGSAIAPNQIAGEDAGGTSASATDAWREITPDKRHTWLVPGNADAFDAFIPIGSRSSKAATEIDVPCVFKEYSRGIATCRDDVVYDFNRDALVKRVKEFIENYNAEIDRWTRSKDKPPIDDFVRYEKIKWSMGLKLQLQRFHYAEFDDAKLREALYRPFCTKFVLLDRVVNEAIYQMPRIVPNPKAQLENRLLVVASYDRKEFTAYLSDRLLDLNFYADPAQSFPFFVYDEDGSNRRENITDWALKQFREQYGDKKIAKWDIFYYVYGLLHHPEYRTKFADNLKRELPRIPFAPDFRAFARAGKELAHWHLDYEEIGPHALKFVETKGVPLSYRVEDKMRLTKDKMGLVVNKSLTLMGIPEKCFEYRLGNRSALEWVVDQYQVKKDARTGTVSDPNREDDPEYIVRLVGQVIRVSLETVRIVEGLPKEFGG